VLYNIYFYVLSVRVFVVFFLRRREHRCGNASLKGRKMHSDSEARIKVNDVFVAAERAPGSSPSTNQESTMDVISIQQHLLHNRHKWQQVKRFLYTNAAAE
jgi:hypothetical protein